MAVNAVNSSATIVYHGDQRIVYSQQADFSPLIRSDDHVDGVPTVQSTVTTCLSIRYLVNQIHALICGQ